MAARGQEVVDLLGHDAAIGDLHGHGGAGGGGPGDHVVEGHVGGHVLHGHIDPAVQTAGAADAQLGRDVQQIGVFEGGALGLAEIQDLPDGIADDELRLLDVLQVDAEAAGEPVVEPDHVGVARGEEHGAVARHLHQLAAEGPGLLGTGALPLGIGHVVHARGPPHQGGLVVPLHLAGDAALAVEGGAGLGIDVAVAGGVDDDLGEDRLAPGLALEDDALDLLALHDGLGAPAVEQHFDIGLLLDHQVHLDLQLLRVIGGGAGQHLFRAEAGGAEGDLLPLADEDGIVFADVVQPGAEIGFRRGLVQAGEPLLLDAPDHGVILPAEGGHYQHIAPGDVAAEVAVALHEDDLRIPVGPGCRDGRAVARRAAAHDQDVAFPVDRQFIGCFPIDFAHAISFLSDLNYTVNIYK